MLARDEVLRKMAGFDCPSYLHESCWQPIYDQCVAAIDLAAENARLKADMKELIAGNETIHSIIDGTIKMSGDMISMIRIGLIDMFRSSGATNFLIQNLKDTKTGEEFTMNIQKTDALLPEQKYITAQIENERLKAELAEYAETFHEQNKALSDNIIKLDAVRTECYKHIPANKIERRCLLDEYDIGQADLADNVLAIIDKDGDKDA